MMDMAMREVSALDEGVVLQLLAYAAAENQAAGLFKGYVHRLKGRYLYIAEVENEIRGCIGIWPTEDSDAEILHIAVEPRYRKSGIGAQMISRVQESHQFRRMEAETDEEAVGFYRNCGFRIESLGEKYLDVERFKCIKEFS
ncbi:GNAT family N-acetyltransferase [Indiicoccus explosivorum]|uniref:GNAT family N-acetyltransferase n=1 Tax=Indiicoccus explosivorum TaxID=1917864 RepID=UPI001F4E44E2|nr:GNAT family N-acetyltransferase [Indiicoccus explosivorum]